MMTTLAEARAQDRADSLRGFRSRFILPRGVIYLDGNSLGPPPASAGARMATAVGSEWGHGLVRSWNDADWIGAPARVGAKIAGLIGAAPHEVIVADSTSVNLFKLLVAGIANRPGRSAILTVTGDFPTDLYLARDAASVLPGVDVRAVPEGRIEAELDQSVAVLLLGHVHYKTAARRDMAAITDKAHAVGALTLWDLSHSAGAVDVDLRGSGADLAVGCGYKFLNGGPGAPAWLFVAERLQAALRSPLSGWMGHAAPFEFLDAYEPAPGVARFLCGTPPMLSLLALETAIDLWLEVDGPDVWSKAARLWDLFSQRMAIRCEGHGFELITPAHADSRGSHIAFRHPRAFAIIQSLIARGVVGDFRDPDILRFGLTPLYLRYQDVWRAVETLYEIMQSGSWREAPPRVVGAVT
ncbi:MAG TPA: kynureninase [Caulobacteraceae bacterium]